MVSILTAMHAGREMKNTYYLVKFTITEEMYICNSFCSVKNNLNHYLITGGEPDFCSVP